MRGTYGAPDLETSLGGAFEVARVDFMELQTWREVSGDLSRILSMISPILTHRVFRLLLQVGDLLVSEVLVEDLLVSEMMSANDDSAAGEEEKSKGKAPIAIIPRSVGGTAISKCPAPVVMGNSVKKPKTHPSRCPINWKEVPGLENCSKEHVTSEGVKDLQLSLDTCWNTLRHQETYEDLHELEAVTTEKIDGKAGAEFTKCRDSMAALQYLESLRNVHPELSEWYATLSDLYQRKLWHQLTLKLEQFVALAVFQAGDALIQLYHNFIADFETKINLLKLGHFAVIVSRQYLDKGAAINYLEGVIEKLRSTTGHTRVEEAVLYVKMQVALFKLEQGEGKECKSLIEEGKSTLDTMTDIDPSVYASYYWVSSQYYKSRQEFAEFYKSALLYLAYTSVESFSESFKLDLAFDLSLAALLGESIYNFGELLAHPIIKSLIGTIFEWLYHILEAFNSGDLVRYQELCRVHGAALNRQPALVKNEKKLLEKINIFCLMEIIFSRPAEDRNIPLKVIAERTKLTVEDVEHLLMKSLSVHLIEGIIDQVEGTVHVSWVQPRVLGVPQIKSLRDRLDNWVDKVNTALLSVEAETPDLVAA
ncbi:Proteasome component domain protein [Perilla frutescens var. hirtella]|nr:Proteasome component domain protein [Perilla frutescens var. hirtella]